MSCVVQGTELLQRAKTKYSAKDLMGALKLYEDVLAQVGQLCRPARPSEPAILSAFM